MARLTLNLLLAPSINSNCFILPGLFFVPVKWNPNLVSWSLLVSLHSRGAGMWVMVMSWQANSRDNTETLGGVTVTRDTGSVLRSEPAAPWTPRQIPFTCYLEASASIPGPEGPQGGPPLLVRYKNTCISPGQKRSQNSQNGFYFSSEHVYLDLISFPQCSDQPPEKVAARASGDWWPFPG